MSAPASPALLSASRAPNVSSGEVSASSESEGREWSKMGMKGGEILMGCFLLALTILSVAAVVIGIAALVNPAGLALVGASVGAAVTAGLAVAADNAIAVLVVGSVGASLLCIVAAISLIAKKKKGEGESSASDD
jgi:hypothetical protein